MNMNISSKLLFLFSVLILIYVGIAFSAPFILKKGNYILGNGIYEVYERFCHQRVERSLFLFGRQSFYSVQELKEEAFISPISKTNTYLEYFGHKYNGNETVGYKVAICIRDIALYTTLGFVGLFISLSPLGKRRFSMALVVILTAPIFIDVFIQMIIKFIKLDPIPYFFLDNVPKRIFTGILAGIGVVMGLNNLLGNSLTIKEEKEKM